MTKKREELLTRMIRIYGFEHKKVIEFAELLETKQSDRILETLVEICERHPHREEED